MDSVVQVKSSRTAAALACNFTRGLSEVAVNE